MTQEQLAQAIAYKFAEIFPTVQFWLDVPFQNAPTPFFKLSVISAEQVQELGPMYWRRMSYSVKYETDGENLDSEVRNITEEIFEKFDNIAGMFKTRDVEVQQAAGGGVILFKLSGQYREREFEEYMAEMELRATYGY